MMKKRIMGADRHTKRISNILNGQAQPRPCQAPPSSASNTSCSARTMCRAISDARTTDRCRSCPLTMTCHRPSNQTMTFHLTNRLSRRSHYLINSKILTMWRNPRSRHRKPRDQVRPQSQRRNKHCYRRKSETSPMKSQRGNVRD